jgi:predicted N-acyltransferase
MRAPVPFLPPCLPVVASPVIRDDVPLDDIPASEWNALAGSQPFLSHAFLAGLHDTGCASPQTGWSPQYVTAWRDGALTGALPLYAKAHSYGEYVFDWGWADAYRRHGRRYYPKWVVAVPFTPVPGPRLLAPDSATRHALLAYAIERVREGGHSSLHVLFPTPTEATEGEAVGMIRRAGLQFHWTNPGYRDFADFLTTFTHDKRKKVKQERRRLAESGVTFERIRGPAITSGDWEFFYRRYERTYREHHSTPYLSLEFFQRIGEALPGNLLLVVGSRRGRRICAALGLHDGDALWGRYWGTTEFVSVCISKPATTNRSNSASSSALPASRAAHRGSTSLRAVCCPWKRTRCTSLATPALRRPSRTTARANAPTLRTPRANWRRLRHSGMRIDH